MTTPATIPTAQKQSPLHYLHDAIEDLKAKHLYFQLRLLEGEQVLTRIPGLGYYVV